MQELNFEQMETTIGGQFWGKDITNTRDWADGNCAYRETTWNYYIFWIKVGSGTDTETISC